MIAHLNRSSFWIPILALVPFVLGIARCGGATDADGDGYLPPDDCDDLDPDTYPGAPEVCDGVDNSCNGEVDEGVTSRWYVDADGDGVGAGDGVDACEAPAGYVPSSGDCDDSDAAVYPGASEVCGDAIDQSCDGKDEVCAPCPPDMVLAGSACIDRYEASIQDWSPYEVPSGGVAISVEGVVPQGYISGDVAKKACEAAGKRLCSVNEWMRACQGPYGWTWPYGNTYISGACNDTYPGTHPVVDYYGTSSGVWDSAHMNDPGINQQPDTVDLTGANEQCVSYEGVFDMHGNMHEWISDSAGTFKGGFYADGSTNGSGCYYTTTAHDFYYHDYSTGFRCCMNPLY